MTVQVVEQGAVSTRAEIYDFRAPASLAREQARALELGFETFARQWGTQLTAKLRVVSRVTLETVAMSSYDDYVSSLPATSAMTLCTVAAVTPRAVVQYPATVALSWIGRMLGGSGALQPPERAFTTIELALVRRLVEESLEDLSYSMGSMLPGALAVETLHFNAQFAQAAAPSDQMIVAAFSIRVGEVDSPATVALPAAGVLPHLGTVDEQVPPAEAAARLRTQLASVPVNVNVRFSPLSVNPGEVLGLAVGDVLKLPHPQFRPLDVTVDGEVVARAAAGSTGSRLACVVVDSEES
jgi:flagellar motor switch protein FliM